MKSLSMIDNWSGTLLPGQMSGLIQVVATFTPDREPDRNSVYVVGQCSNTVAGVRRLLRRHAGGERTQTTPSGSGWATGTARTLSTWAGRHLTGLTSTVRDVAGLRICWMAEPGSSTRISNT